MITFMAFCHHCLPYIAVVSAWRAVMVMKRAGAEMTGGIGNLFCLLYRGRPQITIGQPYFPEVSEVITVLSARNLEAPLDSATDTRCRRTMSEVQL
jgi:hypothetical protein